MATSAINTLMQRINTNDPTLGEIILTHRLECARSNERGQEQGCLLFGPGTCDQPLNLLAMYLCQYLSGGAYANKYISKIIVDQLAMMDDIDGLVQVFRWRRFDHVEIIGGFFDIYKCVYLSDL
jgi:hypothetical protein